MPDFSYDDILNNLDQGEGAGTGDYTGVDLGIGGGILDDIQNGGGTSGGSDWTQILKALGLITGGSGGGGMNAILPLLTLLAGGLGTANKNSATSDAAAQLQAGADKASGLSTDLIGGARQAFVPYQEAGTTALSKLSSMVGNNDLAGKFGPVGSNSDLSSKFKGAMTLRALAGK